MVHPNRISAFYFFLLTFFLFSSSGLFSQGSDIHQGNDAFHIIDRMEIKSGELAPIFTAHKYYNRSQVIDYALALDSSSVSLSMVDRMNLFYLFKDSNEWLLHHSNQGGKKMAKNYLDDSETFYTLEEIEWYESESNPRIDKHILSKKPVLKYFYKTPANFLEVDKKGFYLRVNPILHVRVGRDDFQDGFTFQNTRGFTLRGGIDGKVFFETNLRENQSRFPSFYERSILNNNALPGAGFYKLFDTPFGGAGQSYDYLTSQGYVGFQISKHLQVQFGHGRQFIGDGVRSLFLSDYANDYFFMKLSTNIWRFKYQTIFGELGAISTKDIPGDELIPKKYFAAHHLSLNLFKNFQVGIFETVVYNREQMFELQYLNPVILYRTVEGIIGSPDNVLLGVNAKWNIKKQFSLYGQFLLDEFKFDELLVERNGWWGNKFGIQAGVKWIDAAGIDNLDAQYEYNFVRPYTYAHRDSLASYSHNNQSLAHPLGANFSEHIFVLRYQPKAKLSLTAKAIRYKKGMDENGQNWGGDILLPYSTRVQNYENEVGQGAASTVFMGLFRASYQAKHNLYLDFTYTYRNEENISSTFSGTSNYVSLGLRLNTGFIDYDY